MTAVPTTEATPPMPNAQCPMPNAQYPMPYNLPLITMTQPIPPVTLPPSDNPHLEGEWLKERLLRWLDAEFIPEAVNQNIAQRAAQIFVRQRMEGENDLGSLVIAIVTEMQAFDFSKSFYGEFAIANAVSDLLLESLGIDRCCGQ